MSVLYQPQYRVHGTTKWTNFGEPVSVTNVTITGLSPGTLYDFQVLAANVYGTSSSATVSDGTTTPAGVPSDATGFQASRIADMMERFGVNTFSSSDSTYSFGSNTWGPIMPADYRAASVIAGLNWLTANDAGALSGSGMTMLVREYHFESHTSDQLTWCPQVSAGTAAKFTICVGSVPSASQGLGIQTLANASSSGSGWLLYTEGANEPNNSAFGNTEPPDDCVTLQQEMYSYSRGASGMQCISPSVIDTGSFTYISDYFSAAQRATITTNSDLWNIHIYPQQNHDFGGSGANGQLASSVTYESAAYGVTKPCVVTEFHPTLYNNQGNSGNEAYNAYYTAMFFLSCFRLGVLGWFWFSLLEYGTAGSTFSVPVGLFPITGGVNPSASAQVIRAMYALTGDKGSNKRAFSTGKLNYAITGLQPQSGSLAYSGGQHMLFQNSAGQYFLFVWNSQNAPGGLSNQVTITFGSHVMTRVVEYNLTSNPGSNTTPLRTLNNVGSLSMSLDASVHLFVITY